MASQATFRPDKILALASAIRNDGSSAIFCFGTDEKPFAGGECQIYAVKFPDDTIWAVRIPAHAGKCLPADSITGFAEAELAVLTRLGDTGFRWLPKLIGHDSGFDNQIGHPYFVLSWIHGTPLVWTEAIPSERQYRQKILRQIVDIQLELVECTKEFRTDFPIPLLDARLTCGRYRNLCRVVPDRRRRSQDYTRSNRQTVWPSPSRLLHATGISSPCRTQCS